MPAFRFFTALILVAGLAGCDAILSHPAIPSEAKAIAYEGLDQVASLRPEVDQFLGGFRLESREKVNRVKSPALRRCITWPWASTWPLTR